MKHPANRLFGAAVFAAGLVIVALGYASAPTGRYTIANGTVYDSKTKLTWQQAVSSSLYAQAGAASYCSTLALNADAWRLPTMKELVTIVDFSGAPLAMAFDATAFPGTPTSAAFWTSTPYAGATGNTWLVSFSDGTTSHDVASNTYNARCVH